MIKSETNEERVWPACIATRSNVDRKCSNLAKVKHTQCLQEILKDFWDFLTFLRTVRYSQDLRLSWRCFVLLISTGTWQKVRKVESELPTGFLPSFPFIVAITKLISVVLICLKYSCCFFLFLFLFLLYLIVFTGLNVLSTSISRDGISHKKNLGLKRFWNILHYSGYITCCK